MLPRTPDSLEDALFFIDVRAALIKSLCQVMQDTAMNGREDALARVLEMLMVMEDELSHLGTEIEEAEKLTDQGPERIKERRGHILDFRESTHTK